MTRCGGEAAPHRGMVWTATRAPWDLTDQLHPALDAFRLGDFGGAVSRPCFPLCRAGVRELAISLFQRPPCSRVCVLWAHSGGRLGKGVLETVAFHLGLEG